MLAAIALLHFDQHYGASYAKRLSAGKVFDCYDNLSSIAPLDS